MGLKVFDKRKKKYLTGKEICELLKSEFLTWDYEVTYTEEK